MKDQIKTIRSELTSLHGIVGDLSEALAALTQLEAMAGQGELVGWWNGKEAVWLKHELNGYPPPADATIPVYTAAPVAQQYEAGDVASASAQGFRDGVASVAQQPQKLEDVEQYRMQMAGISTAAVGYWKEGDSIHPDYDTPALRDVAKLYAQYDALYKAQQPQADTPQATTIAEAARDVGKWLNERPNRPIDLRHVAMLVAHAMQPQAEAVPVVDRVYEAAKRLVDHADFQLGGVLSAKSKARDIPSNAASKVKARHLASLRDALAKTPQQAEAVQYTRADLDRAYSAGLVEGERLAIQQAEAVPLTHVLVPVDEPTDEMVDAACAAVDGLCRVDFVRAYVAAFSHLKAGYRDESYWCGWNAAIKFQQAEAAHQYNLANRLRVHLANRHTLTGPEFKDGVAAILAEYYAAPQQAEAVPPDVVRDADVEAAAKKMAEIFDYPWDFMPEKGRNTMRENVRAVLDAAIAQQKGQP